MKKYICSVCGYVYDEAQGAENIPPNTKLEDVPKDWECPLCGAPKDAFNEAAVPKDEGPAEKPTKENDHNDNGLSLYEMSALCSNLAKGCEKQQKLEQMELYNLLSDYFKNADNFEDDVTLNELREPVQYDLDGFEDVIKTVKESNDRGALRTLVWSEKVTKIISSILLRYGKQKDALLEGKNVFVCEICGFVYIGNEPPAVCPVCKVPNFKLRKIARR